MVDKARKSNVAIISALHLLTSILKMQALVSAVMASFKTYYEREMDT